MKTNLFVRNFFLACALVVAASRGAVAETLRPPSVPLVACDPYFSIWSPADKLTDADTVHWTGKPHRLLSVVTIDGKDFRLLGGAPTNLPALFQTSVEVLPTRTIYQFEELGVQLTLTFMTPALPDDLDVYSRPVTYLTWTLRATDRQKHEINLLFQASSEIAVNKPDQETAGTLGHMSGLDVVRIGSVAQSVLGRKGDNVRIDWGYLYVAASPSMGFSMVIDHPLNEPWTTSVSSKLFTVSSRSVTRWLMLAYDDEFSIQYFKKNLRPYWRRNGDNASALLKKSAAEYESLQRRCERFDAELMDDLRKAGGERYAQIGALAYRQCVAANKVVADANGQPLMFPKENFSNGCIGTMDVIYPMAPQFLLFNPTLAKAMLVPILDYAGSARWKFPFAPHDLGTYPLANGQVYGGGERTEKNQMPVEETGNALILVAALAQAEGNADFAAKYWPLLEKWAEYLKEKGFDPENQLCTDDFAGHLAHNVNLSAKTICGLGAFGKLCALRGDRAKAEEYQSLAREFAARWVKEADDGGHARLAFDKPETWSQKYNLVWDRILGLGCFPDSVRRAEMDFYKTKQNAFGLPLDNRKGYTKLDWTLWSATLTQDRADFDALTEPVWHFLNETPDRVPMTDWFETETPKKAGFQARSVVGGIFLELLYDAKTWNKWAKRDKVKPGNWAPIPE